MGLLNLNLNLNLKFNQKSNIDLSPVYNELLPIYKEALTTSATHSLYEGGRGGAKSSQHTDIKIIESFDPELSKTNFLFTREFQNSIDDSSYWSCNNSLYYWHCNWDIPKCKNGWRRQLWD